MRRLEIPPTLRSIRLHEIPNRADVTESIQRSLEAKIIEGYTLKDNTAHELPFKFYAEINIDNPRLWELFKTLALHLPEEISLIFNHVDGETHYGKYQEKYSVLIDISNYSLELTKDCFLEFGAIHHTDDFLEEVFVDCTKYIKYWGMDEAWFRATMLDYQVFEIPDLNFMDEFPKVREALRLHYPDAIETHDLVNQLLELFT